MNRFLATIAAIALAGTAAAQNAQTATAAFVDSEGEPNGTATLTQTAAGVLIELEVERLPEDSWVAFHIHEVGTCESEVDHESAGGHFNPGDTDHGYHVESGPHAGDMPNQYVPADGTLNAQVFNAFVRLDGDDIGIRGRALMLHANPDDYQSQPSGDAGDRIGCAPIE